MALGSASIFEDINAGYWDEGLDAIIEIAVARRRFLRDAKGAENMVEFQPGTPVRVINIKPKYLAGITGIVSPLTADRRGDLKVAIDARHHHRLGRYGTVLSIPASSLEKL
ncbi:MAG TPA: hypothetical protein VNS88_00350 [Nitrospiraceae bacterium]|nr:hypothetical protein [Nitrospiraceae bacterium]